MRHVTLSEAKSLYCDERDPSVASTLLRVTHRIIMTLSNSFIKSVLEIIDSPDVIGVGIVGSYARGQEIKT